jgi:hypothetical protein
MAWRVIASDLAYFRATLAGDPDARVPFPLEDAADMAASVERYFALPVSVPHLAARRASGGCAPDNVVRPVGKWLGRNLSKRLDKPGYLVTAACAQY